MVWFMSRSDCGGEKAMAVAGSIDDLTADAHAGALPPAGLRAVMSAAIRLYAAAVEAAGVEIAPANPEISATDAMVLACALVRSQDFTPFDLALWFSRTSQIGVSSGSGVSRAGEPLLGSDVVLNPTK
jgi:hypothetical protein